MTAAGHEDRIAAEVAQLRRELAGRVPAEVLDRAIDETVRDLADARVKDFVPVLVHTSVRRRVRELVPPQRATG